MTQRITFTCEVDVEAAHAFLRQLEAWAPFNPSVEEERCFNQCHGLLIERLKAALSRARSRGRMDDGIEPGKGRREQNGKKGSLKGAG